MANYSYIGYAPGVISVSFTTFSTGNITLSASYDPSTDRRVFDVEDAAGGTLVNGAPDNGTDFNGDRFDDEDGDDLTQSGDVTNLDGSTTFLSGAIYLEETYALAKPGGGTIDVYRVEVEGALAGYITSEPLVAGVTYTFVRSNVTPTNAPDTTDPTALVDVPCFVSGTLIATPFGQTPVEHLETGDPVSTVDGDTRTIRWIGSRIVDVSQEQFAHLKPIRIAAGALGAGVPRTDLYVSPNHRIMIANANSEIYFEAEAVLVPAKALLDLPGVRVQHQTPRVAYYHFLFDTHEIVISNGAPTESLYPGDIALRGMAAESKRELYEIFPDILSLSRNSYGPTAAKVLKMYEVPLLFSEFSARL